MVLGSVRGSSFGVPVLAHLSDDRTWGIECDDDDARECARLVLDRIASDYRGPSDGFYGPRQLQQAAEALRGTFSLDVEFRGKPERIY